MEANLLKRTDLISEVFINLAIYNSNDECCQSDLHPLPRQWRAVPEGANEALTPTAIVCMLFSVGGLLINDLKPICNAGV